jgi:hypothetical protein
MNTDSKGSGCFEMSQQKQNCTCTDIEVLDVG